MEWLIGVTILVLGMGIGLIIALVLQYKKVRLRLPNTKNAREHLKLVIEQRAETKAKQKALQREYANHTIDEAVFVSKDAEYTHLIEKYDKEIEHLLSVLASTELPEELKKGDKILQNASDIETLAKEIKKLEEEKQELKHKIDELHLHMREAEEDRKEALAKKNEMSKKYGKMEEEMQIKEQELGDKAIELEDLKKEKEEVEDKLSEARSQESPDETLKNLKRENKLLRESLEEKNKRLNQLSKNIGVLKTVFDKYSSLIEEKEAKTAEELKCLIQPNNPEVKSIIKAYDTPKKAFEFVRDNISEVTPNISATYWLSVEEMLKLRAADTEDEAILLCSLLRAQGEDAKVVVVELDKGIVKTLVALNDRVLDPSVDTEFDDYVGISQEEAIKQYIFDGQFVKKIRYIFNDKTYEHHEE